MWVQYTHTYTLYSLGGIGMGMGLSVTLNPNGVGLETALKAPLLSQSGVGGGPTAPLQPLFPIATMAQVALAQPTSAPSQLPLQQPPPTSRTHRSPSPPPSPTRPLLGSSSGSIVGLRGPDSGQNEGTGTGDCSSQGRDSPELIPSTV
ncbi:splicing factor, proline- and glutamine-rich-like isoform X1 [Portunus trituberculatus]|uniref:splicing factor, proline- and glutamine-rich-like isoform X1 n=2 Tax=Portunus trituberculatus TaxID=210409 RepID=UPI001E1CEBE9|nr:splicing factor, proline- and glutamine-rich-like isoform X1 [Portunus trituberculatus]